MKKYKLKELLTIKNGKDHKELPDGKFPVYGSGGLMRYVNEFLYDKESILLPRKGTLSNIQYVNTPFWTVDTLYYTVVDTKKVNTFYLYYLIKQFDLSKLNTGTGVPSMTFDAYYDLEVCIPDILMQNRIADILKSLDSKIALNNRINTELEAMAKTVYDYWFVQFDFPFDFAQGKPSAAGKPYKSSGGKMVWREELKREVPEGWEVGELSDLAISIIRGISPKYIEDNGICVLNQKCIRDNSINYESSRRHDNKIKDASARFIKCGDILVNSTGFGTLGRVAFVKWLQEESITVDSHVTIVRPNEKIINSEYLAYSVQYKQTEIENMAEGSTGQTELSRVKLGSLKVIIPSKELQQNFAAIVKPQIQKIANNQQENQQLSSLRDWLLPMLMNGQVKVGEVEAEVLRAAEPGVEYGE